MKIKHIIQIFQTDNLRFLSYHQLLSTLSTPRLKCFLMSMLMLAKTLGYSHNTPLYSYDVAYQRQNIMQVSQKSMVVTEHQIATQIGIDILHRGGNAVDAAVGVGFALIVLLPHAASLGGGGGMLVHMRAQNTTAAIDYHSQVPRKMRSGFHYMTSNMTALQTFDTFSYQNVAVPGTVAGLWETHCRYGKLSWKTLVEPAIKLAHDGTFLEQAVAFAMAQRKHIFLKDNAAAHIFLKKDQTVYQTGELFQQPDLAWSLLQIQREGAKGFYRGKLAEKLINAIQAKDGLITANDLKNYKVKFTTPIWSNYRSYRIASMPPPFAGLTLATIMHWLQYFPVKTFGLHTDLSTHWSLEAFRFVRNDSNQTKHPFKYWDCLKNNLYNMIRTAHTEHIDRNSTTSQQISDRLLDNDQNTTHYSIVDQYGNAVSNTYTLSSSFGAHVVPPGTGILLNNSLQNSHRQHKHSVYRVLLSHIVDIPSSMTPLIVFKSNKPWLVTGTPGGKYIVSIMIQFLLYLIDHQLNLAQATLRPRFFQYTSHMPLELERSVTSKQIALLKSQGYTVKRVKNMGSLQSILIENGLLYGYADKRRSNAVAKGL